MLLTVGEFMKKIKRLSFSMLNLAFCCYMLSGCSVYMSAKKEGAEFEDLQQCKTKTCLVAAGAEPLHLDGLGDDTEAYKVLKLHGSIARAVMHGVLDVATWGLWEIAGTSMEGAFDKNKYYGIRVQYEHGTELIKQISLAQ
jgi:hypothetical protein